jgi:hypothetical protein
VIQVSRKKITPANSPIGEREYKDMLPEGVKEPLEVSRHVVRELKRIMYPFLELPVRHNYQWTSTTILDLVLRASQRNAFLEDTVKSTKLRFPRKIRGIPVPVPVVPTARTVFNRVEKVPTEEWKQKYIEANHKLLEKARKARKFKGWVDLAVDVHDIPFYGNKNTKGIVGTKHKLGTCWAFRYMTACITTMKDHYTLAGTPMTTLTSIPKTLKEILDQAMTYIDGHICITYVDRGFFNVPCIKVLEQYPFKYLMPAIKNSKIKKIIKKTRDYPAVMPYTMGSRGKTVEFTLILVETVKEKGKERKKEVYAFATNLTVDKSQVEKLCELYRNGWTVETSYRMLGEIRTKTTSHNYAARWFFVLFGLLVRNGYYLFNDIAEGIIHVSLKTFTELVFDIGSSGTSSITREGDG